MPTPADEIEGMLQDAGGGLSVAWASVQGFGILRRHHVDDDYGERMRVKGKLYGLTVPAAKFAEVPIGARLTAAGATYILRGYGDIDDARLERLILERA